MSESFKPISHPHLQKTFSIQAAPDDSMLSGRNNRTTAVSTSDFVAATAHSPGPGGLCSTGFFKSARWGPVILHHTAGLKHTESGSISDSGFQTMIVTQSSQLAFGAVTVMILT
jgi:hypothetical protein